jgi:hypothetical protein
MINSVWKPFSVADEPRTKLTNWRVYSVKLTEEVSTIHFVGYAGYEGRVSSAIQEYDVTTKCGRSSSGRIYELSGTSGYNYDAQYVWGRWLFREDDPEYVDVTENYD